MELSGSANRSNSASSQRSSTSSPIGMRPIPPAATITTSRPRLSRTAPDRTRNTTRSGEPGVEAQTPDPDETMRVTLMPSSTREVCAQLRSDDSADTVASPNTERSAAAADSGSDASACSRITRSTTGATLRQRWHAPDIHLPHRIVQFATGTDTTMCAVLASVYRRDPSRGSRWVRDGARPSTRVPGRSPEEQVPMPRLRGRSTTTRVGRTTRRARTVDPEERSDGGTARTDGAISYSVRICGRCRKAAETDGKGGARCPSCGRTRGWL